MGHSSNQQLPCNNTDPGEDEKMRMAEDQFLTERDMSESPEISGARDLLDFIIDMVNREEDWPFPPDDDDEVNKERMIQLWLQSKEK